MKQYPKIKNNGKEVEIVKEIFDWYRDLIAKVTKETNMTGKMGLSKSQIDTIALNCATFIYSPDQK